MEYLKVWTSFREAIVPLNDAEKGRLFDAMLYYAETGEEPQEFKGNERFLWAVAKQDIDRTAQKCETLKANASKGGLAKSRNRQAENSKEYQTVADSSKDKQNEAEDAYKKKSNVKKDNEKVINEKFERFWSAYPRHQDRKKAEDAFRRINPDDDLLNKMIASIEKQKSSAQWQENGGQFIPHPTTWLHGKRWEDEMQASRNNSNVRQMNPAQQYSQRNYTEPGETLEDLMRRSGAL